MAKPQDSFPVGYWVPAKIAWAITNYEDRCFRYCGQPGDILHVWWSSPKLTAFWSRVYGLLQTLFHLLIPKNVSLAFNLRQQKWSIYLFLTAKQTIAWAYKKSSVRFQEVKDHMNQLLANKKITSILNDSKSKSLNSSMPAVLRPTLTFTCNCFSTGLWSQVHGRATPLPFPFYSPFVLVTSVYLSHLLLFFLLIASLFWTNYGWFLTFHWDAPWICLAGTPYRCKFVLLLIPCYWFSVTGFAICYCRCVGLFYAVLFSRQQYHKKPTVI